MVYALTLNNTRGAKPPVMFVNAGELRYDIYGGAFTKNDQLTASPFTDSFLYIPDVPLSVVAQVLPGLNGVGAPAKRELLEAREAERYARGDVSGRYQKWLEQMHRYSGENQRRAQENLTLGYVTNDVRCMPPRIPDPY